MVLQVIRRIRRVSHNTRPLLTLQDNFPLLNALKTRGQHLHTSRFPKISSISKPNLHSFDTRFSIQGCRQNLYNRVTSLNQHNYVQHRTLFIQTEETPNPSSLKFLPGEEVLAPEFGQTMQFRKSERQGYANSPLAKRLFRIEGIDSVMLGKDFISVMKNDSVTWNQLKPEVFGCLMDFFEVDLDSSSKNKRQQAVTGAQMLTNKDGEQGQKGESVGVTSEMSEEDAEVVELIKELLEERIRPMVQEDGGDIFFQSYDGKTGVVTVKLAGSCEGCPSSTVTLKNGVENMLMHYIPEVTRVDQFYEDEELNERKLHFTPSV